MAKKRYKFNPKTLTYELISIPVRIKFYRVLRKVIVGFILASFVNLAFSFFFYTPKMYRIDRDNRELMLKYTFLQNKIKSSENKLRTIRQRDNHVYRQLFGADSLSLHGVNAEYADTRYEYLQGDIYSPLMTATWKDMDALARMLYLESKSLDELELLSKDKELMAESIPAIWPINKKYLRGGIGAFGYRIHPIHKRGLNHKGIDLGGNTGSPIYATGDGVVAFDNMGTAGYGRQVLLDHGFGYKTRYAHLSKILVESGQRVERGELIGEMGSTGTSTSSHLHYEVIYRGAPVNPINYLGREMTEKEFTKIIESVEATTFESY